MAGDWIKMASNLHDAPKVMTLADLIGLDVFAVVGRLHRLWSWLDAHTEDGAGVCVTATAIDRVVHHDGFADGLRKIGWLTGTDADLTFTNFTEHNGSTAKKRAQDAQRQGKKRRSDAPTGVSRQIVASERDGSVTKMRPREEKRREEKSKNPPSPPAGGTADATGFDEWWQGYPVRDANTPRGNKRKAWTEWVRLSEADRARVAEATRRLVASGQMPKDAERFLRPPSGGGDPPWRAWLEGSSGAPVASGGKLTVAQEKEQRNHAYDGSWLSETA